MLIGLFLFAKCCNFTRPLAIYLIEDENFRLGQRRSEGGTRDLRYEAIFRENISDGPGFKKPGKNPTTDYFRETRARTRLS